MINILTSILLCLIQIKLYGNKDIINNRMYGAEYAQNNYYAGPYTNTGGMAMNVIGADMGTSGTIFNNMFMFAGNPTAL